MAEIRTPNPLEARRLAAVTHFRETLPETSQLRRGSQMREHVIDGMATAWTATSILQLRSLIGSRLENIRGDFIHPNARRIMNIGTYTPSKINPVAEEQRTYEVERGQEIVTQLDELTQGDGLPFARMQQRAAVLIAQLRLTVVGDSYQSGQTLRQRQEAFEENIELISRTCSRHIRTLQHQVTDLQSPLPGPTQPDDSTDMGSGLIRRINTLLQENSPDGTVPPVEMPLGTDIVLNKIKTTLSGYEKTL